eukprot:2788419-Rhodomonas_salina.2
MVKFEVNLEECGGIVNWKQVAGIVDEKPAQRPKAQGPSGDDDNSGIEDEEGDGDGKADGARPGGIFDRIIAKWGGYSGGPQVGMHCVRCVRRPDAPDRSELTWFRVSGGGG